MNNLLEIATLGGLRIHLDGAEIGRMRSRKAEALLVYLACSRRPQAREVLADLLWDERSTAHGLTNLRWLLNQLGRQLAPYLTITRSTIALNLDSPYWLDVADFEHTLAAARSMRTRGDALAPVAVRDLEQAITLYGGSFLEGFYVQECSGFEEWMLREQDRLQRQAAAALYDLTTFYFEQGDSSTGISFAAQLLQLDPLHEETHRRLMQMLALSGQRRAALEQYETCRRILATELDALPDPATTELYERIHAGGYPAASPVQPDKERGTGQAIAAAQRHARPQNLPQPLTPFVGRECELAELTAYLADPDCHLITLVGTGGMGKTRLAIQAARAVPGFAGGVYFVSLASMADPAFLVPVIADAVQFSFSGGQDPKDQLVSYLSDRQLLLILDNFEHLLPAASLLPELLESAPGVKIMATSRQPLDLAAEQVFEVEGLPVPPVGEADTSPRDLERFGAVKLFVQRARRVQSRFTLSPSVAPSVAQICRLVEGLPLGIELAAIWVRERSCQDIARTLETDLDLLASSQGDVPPRHRSLRAVFDESWRLLTDEERAAERVLSIFRGGFDLQAGREVAGVDRALLAGLVRRSILRQSPSGRYDMHELLRQYTSERLWENPDRAASAGRRQAAYFLALAEESHLELVGPKQVEWSNRLEQEHDNLRAALSWAIDMRDADTALSIASSLSRFWYFRGYLADGRRWCKAVLQIAGDDSSPLLRAKVLNLAGVLAREQGDLAEATSLVEQSVALLRTLGNKTVLAGPLVNLGLNARDIHDYPKAETLMREALDLYRERDDRQGVALALNNLGKIILWGGDPGHAGALIQESLEIFRSLDETRGMALALVNLGQVARDEGRYDHAAGLFREGLLRYRDLGDRRGIQDCLEGLAVAYAAEDRSGVEAKQIAMLCGVAASLRVSIGAQPYPVDSAHLERTICTLRSRLGEDAWLAMLSGGKAMPLDQAITYALQIPAHAARRRPGQE